MISTVKLMNVQKGTKKNATPLSKLFVKTHTY